MQRYLTSRKKSLSANFILVTKPEITEKFISKIKDDYTAVLVLESDNPHAAAELRSAVFSLISFHCKCPVIIKRNYSDNSIEEFQIFAATDIELLFADGLADGIWLEAAEEGNGQRLLKRLLSIFCRQQGQGYTKPNIFHALPAGRTSFNVFETIERIKRFTAHLKGLKLAVMG